MEVQQSESTNNISGTDEIMDFGSNGSSDNATDVAPNNPQKRYRRPSLPFPFNVRGRRPSLDYKNNLMSKIPEE